MKTFYVYIYYTPDKIPIYVGKGTGNRSNKHLYSNTNVHLNNKIKKLKSENLKPIISIIECLDEKDAFNKEKQLILEIGREDLGLGTLYNHTDGGEGISNPSIESRRKMSLAKLGKSSSKRGIPMSLEQKIKLSKALSGRIITKESRLKMSKTRKGRSHSKQHSNQISMALTGHSVSDETKLKISNAAKNQFSKILVCPICNHHGKGPQMYQRHFKNCKY